VFEIEISLLIDKQNPRVGSLKEKDQSDPSKEYQREGYVKGWE